MSTNITPDGIDAGAIRAWAVNNGHPDLAGKRGRLPAAVIVAYLNAHGTSTDSPSPEEAA